MEKITAVLLAGTLKPTTLRRGIGMPVVCLPIAQASTLLDAWLHALAALEPLSAIRVVVNTNTDAAHVEASLSQSREGVQPAPVVRPEPAAWRGAAGIIRDVTDDVPPDSLVLVIEATCLPPLSLRPLFEANGGGICGSVAIAGHDQPAGAYLLTRSAIEQVPNRGYCDLKEQLLPSLAAAGLRIRPTLVGERVHRVRDRESYLNAIRHVAPRSVVSVASDASLSASAALDGHVIVSSGAVIEDGAVVHDSVVLAGAIVGGGAVVSQSIVGRNAAVGPRSHCVREIVPARRRSEHAAHEAAGGAAAPRQRLGWVHRG